MQFCEDKISKIKRTPTLPIDQDLKDKIIDYWLYNKNNSIPAMVAVFKRSGSQINKIIDKHLNSKKPLS